LIAVGVTALVSAVGTPLLGFGYLDFLFLLALAAAVGLVLDPSVWGGVVLSASIYVGQLAGVLFYPGDAGSDTAAFFLIFAIVFIPVGIGLLFLVVYLARRLRSVSPSPASGAVRRASERSAETAGSGTTSPEPTETRSATPGRWLTIVQIGLCIVVGGLLLVALPITPIRHTKDKHAFAAMEGAFGRVRLPDGYVLVRSERQGSCDVFGCYGITGEFRVYAVPRDSGAPDELVSALEAAGFIVGQNYQCTIIADQGSIDLYLEFHSKPERIDVPQPVCGTGVWPHVYLWVEITDLAS